MKVLLTKDVYKLGRAGDVKRVADGYGRNYLLPQGLAVLATPGALKRVESIRTKAAEQRTELNKEMGGLAEKLSGVYVSFGVKAGETGKLYGSITPAMVAEAVSQKIGAPVDRHLIEIAPIRTLGEFKAMVRLTVDLIPEVKVIVHREGEILSLPGAEAQSETVAAAEVPAEDAPAAEALVDDAPVAEPPVEDAPAAEAPVEDNPAAKSAEATEA
jgi:large subunit ribosomal protein L9